MSDALDAFPFKWIARDLQRGNVIPFLGAGASLYDRNAAACPPSASALARELAEASSFPLLALAAAKIQEQDATAAEQRVRAAIDCGNLSMVSSWVQHVMGDRRRIRDTLREWLADSQHPITFNGLHEILARAAQVAPMAIVTTNYDDLMEQALRARGVAFDLFVVAIDRQEGAPGGTGQLLFRAAEEAKLRAVKAEGEHLALETREGSLRLARTALFKIHGHVDRGDPGFDTFVITEEDYVAFLGRMGQGTPLIPADLTSLMQRRSFLFLGYGLRDWNMRVLLDRLAQQQVTQNLRSYAIALDIGPVEKELWKRRGVETFNADLAEFVTRIAPQLPLPEAPTPWRGPAP